MNGPFYSRDSWGEPNDRGRPHGDDRERVADPHPRPIHATLLGWILLGPLAAYAPKDVGTPLALRVRSAETNGEWRALLVAEGFMMSVKLSALILGAMILPAIGLSDAKSNIAQRTVSSVSQQRVSAASVTTSPPHGDTAVTVTAVMASAAKNWRAVPPLDAVALVSNTVGFVAGRGAIYRSASAGRHWRREYAGHDEILGLDMVTPNMGWAWSPYHVLRDVAGHWTLGREPAVGPLHMTDFLSQRVGYGLAGPLTEPAFQDGLTHQEVGDVVVTHDGGRRWTVVRTPFGQAGALLFVSSTHGLAIAHRQLWTTKSGGRTWRRVATLPIAAGIAWSYQWARGPGAAVWILARGANAGLGNLAYSVLKTNLNGTRLRQVFNEGYMDPGDYPKLSPAQSVNFGERAGWLAASPLVGQVAFAGWQTSHLRITLTSARRPRRFLHLVLAGQSANWLFFETPMALAMRPKWMLLVGQGTEHGRLLVSRNQGRTWRAVVP